MRKLNGIFISSLLMLNVSTLYGESYQDFLNSQAKSYQKYKDENDAKFNSYLKEQFKAYDVFRGKPLYEKPKPKRIVKTKPKKVKPVGPKVVIKVVKVKYVEPKPVQKVVEVLKVAKVKKIVKVKEVAKAPKEKKVKKLIKHPAIDSNKKDINFNFYGSELAFNLPAGVKKASFTPKTQKGISNYFDSVASSEYKPFIDEIKRVKKVMKLNDWALYLLVNKIGDRAYNSKDNSNLLSWFILNKMGYAVKVGLAKSHIVLMHYSKKTIYSTPAYNFSKKKFYVVANYNKGTVGRLYSYKHDYPGATKPMNLAMNTLPNFSSDMRNKKLKFEQFGKKYSIDFQYNKNLIDFMATYPQADYETFFNTPLDVRTYGDIASGLKKHIDGMQASEGMNFVLNFVQKAFKYERDDQQFGREKVMFAQETLYFNKSDCEDRAVLFSYLVKELFSVGVVGVKYSDHMATALYLPMKGDTVKSNNTTLIVADPTYVNSNIGQSMPKYKRKNPDSFVYIK